MNAGIFSEGALDILAIANQLNLITFLGPLLTHLF
jgi:hypothetical protein